MTARRPSVIRLAAVVLVAAGCMPVGPAAPPMDRPGPTLVAEIANRTDREVAFGYEFEAADGSSAGSGEGVVSACSVLTDTWGQITGDYALTLDGAVVLEGRIAGGQGEDAFLFVSIRIAPDGEAEAAPPVLRAAAPPFASRPIVGC